MTKEKYLSIKQELKELASEIPEKKRNFKNAQRAISHFENEHGGYDTMVHEGSWPQLRDEYFKLCDAKIKADPCGAKSVYRHEHIAYSMIRGRKREEIEQPRVGNQPDEGYISRILSGWGYETYWEGGKIRIKWEKAPFIPKRVQAEAAKEMLAV